MTLGTQPTEKRLPFGVYAGPTLWAVQLLAGYGLATLAGINGMKLWYFILSALVVIIILLSAAQMFTAWKRTTAQDHPDLSTLDEPASLSAFISASGFYLSTLFFFLALLTGLFAIFLSARPFITMPFP